MRATEGPSYWLRAFGAEAAGGGVTGLERYESMVSDDATRPSPPRIAQERTPSEHPWRTSDKTSTG
jgi:hypothetical protein